MTRHAPTVRRAVFGKLEAAEQRLTERLPHRLSLLAERQAPTSLDEVAAQLCDRHPDLLADPHHMTDAGLFLLELAEVVAVHFPDNLFWDLDFIAADIFRHAVDSDLGPRRYLREAHGLLLRLVSLYGVHGDIRFRYAHDFLYGFDWARWVPRDPANEVVAPFAMPFLQYSHGRGHQLLQLIADNDTKYPPLVDDEHRNPFSFSRAPEEERALHEELARRDLIPVRAWDMDDQPRPGVRFSEERDRIAAAMGMGPS